MDENNKYLIEIILETTTEGEYDNSTVRRVTQYRGKSEKTRKMYCRDPCTFKALYATRKYGCSGLKDKTECLSCEFRR